MNGQGAANIAAACAASGAVLVHVSTDYVFGGDGPAALRGRRRPGPRTAYGRTKLAGEQAVAQAAPRHRLRGPDGLALRRARA